MKSQCKMWKGLVGILVLCLWASGAWAIPIVIDNEDGGPAFALSGGGWNSGTETGEYGLNSNHSRNQDAMAYYNFTGLVNDAYYVWATWPNSSNPSADFNVTPGGGSTTTVSVDQTTAPDVDLVLFDSIESENVNFELLATVIVTDGTLAVVWDQSSDWTSNPWCWLQADAVAVERVPEAISTVGLLGLGGLLLVRRRKIKN